MTLFCHLENGLNSRLDEKFRKHKHGGWGEGGGENGQEVHPLYPHPPHTFGFF